MKHQTKNKLLLLFLWVKMKFLAKLLLLPQTTLNPMATQLRRKATAKNYSQHDESVCFKDILARTKANAFVVLLV